MSPLSPFKTGDIKAIVASFRADDARLAQITGFKACTQDSSVFELLLSDGAHCFLSVTDYFNEDFGYAMEMFSALSAVDDKDDHMEGDFLSLDRPTVERIVPEPQEGVIWAEDSSHDQLNKVLRLEDAGVKWGVYGYAVMYRKGGRAHG